MDMPIKEDDNKMYMIDSGAAISVAPKSEFKKIPLEKKERFNYSLQSATGQRLSTYGKKKCTI